MATSEEIIFKERIWPSPGFFIATLLIIPSMTVLFMPFSRTNGIYVGIILYFLIIAIFSLTAPKVILTNETLKAGRGLIETKYLDNAIALDRVSYRQAVGRRLDARAFLAISGWAKTGIRVEVTDKTDPTPYWVISTRRPLELAREINKQTS